MKNLLLRIVTLCSKYGNIATDYEAKLLEELVALAVQELGAERVTEIVRQRSRASLPPPSEA